MQEAFWCMKSPLISQDYSHDLSRANDDIQIYVPYGIHHPFSHWHGLINQLHGSEEMASRQVCQGKVKRRFFPREVGPRARPHWRKDAGAHTGVQIGCRSEKGVYSKMRQRFTENKFCHFIFCPIIMYSFFFSLSLCICINLDIYIHQ